jgi:DNA-binding transcriptional LysR family regulator
LNQIKFNEVDLNLLRVFNALMEERSVTRAGERLNVTPSAVSHSLNRLRYILKDRLFTRGPNGMQPTAMAIDVGPKVQQALLQLQSALTPSVFVPAETERRFAISATPYTCWLLLPQLMQRLRRMAPHAEIRVHPSGSGVLDELDSGRIDLAIGVFDRVPARFEFERLLADRMVWATRDGLLPGRALALEALAALPHVVLSTQADADAEGLVRHGGFVRRVVLDDRGRLEAVLARHGLQRTIALSVPDALSALAIVAGSDFVTLSPRRLAAAMAPSYGLTLFDPPYDCPEIVFDVLWRREPDPGPAVNWLRALLLEVARGL